MPLIKEDILFGRIALLNHFITEEQLAEARKEQEKRPIFSPVALILVAKGYLNREQFRDIIETQKRRLPKPAITQQEKREDMVFGYLAVKKSYIDEESVYKCLALQGKMSRKGLLFRLSELLVNKSYMSLQQAEKILHEQDRLIMPCTGCDIRYNILGIQTPKFSCRRCGAVLTIPADLYNSYKLTEVEAFHKMLEKIAKNKPIPTKSIFKKSAKKTGSLQIVFDGMTESTGAIAESRDEDAFVEEDIELTEGVVETSEEYEFDDIEAAEEYITAGICRPHHGSHYDEQGYRYRNIFQIDQLTSSEDAIFEDILEEDIIEISGGTIAKKYRANPSHKKLSQKAGIFGTSYRTDDEDEFVDLAMNPTSFIESDTSDDQ